MEKYEALLKINIRPNLEVIIQLGLEDSNEEANQYCTFFLETLQQLLKKVSWLKSVEFIIENIKHDLNHLSQLQDSPCTTEILMYYKIQIEKQDIPGPKYRSRRRFHLEQDLKNDACLQISNDCYDSSLFPLWEYDFSSNYTLLSTILQNLLPQGRTYLPYISRDTAPGLGLNLQHLLQHHHK